MIYHATTILGILHNGKAAIAGDGQVTMEDTIMKRTANKIRKLDDDNILAGFAGTAADAFTPVSYTHLTLPTKRIV